MVNCVMRCQFLFGSVSGWSLLPPPLIMQLHVGIFWHLVIHVVTSRLTGHDENNSPTLDLCAGAEVHATAGWPETKKKSETNTLTRRLLPPRFSPASRSSVCLFVGSIADAS